MPFVTFEGIDGSGKSTLLKLFAQHLKQLGLPVEITREPGGSDLGRELREILLRPEGVPPCPEAELLIYEADRAQHVATKIRPWLDQNIWVLSDRFYDSSLAFQGAGRKLKTEDVIWLNQFATKGLKPALTVLTDCSVDVSQKRRQARKADRFENEKTQFHETVRQEFLAIAKKDPERFFIINSEKAPNELLQMLLTEVKKRGLL
ncbi:MAG: dTMP kinase [Oligoflexia bacterium]|nr:dTMP kinase [Oligoflexia bacterium]